MPTNNNVLRRVNTNGAISTPLASASNVVNNNATASNNNASASANTNGNATMQLYRQAVSGNNGTNTTTTSGTATTTPTNTNGTSGTSGSSSGTSGTSTTQTDQYSALENASWTELLSARIQAENAREQANKYVANSINNSGFQGQGLAESTRAGIYNTYQTALSNADATYQESMSEIAANRAADEQTASAENWQSVMTMLQAATSQEDINFLRERYYNDLTAEQKNYFDYYATSYERAFSEQATYSDLEALKEAYITGTGNEVVQIGNDYPTELNRLNTELTNGTIQAGDTFEIHSTYGNTFYLEYTGAGWNVINAQTYGEGTGRKWNLTVSSDNNSTFTRAN